MSDSLRVVVIGGVAAGPKTAAKIMRLRPDAEVTLLEKGEYLSFAGCGLPYYVSGIVPDRDELYSTPAGTLRTPEFFEKVKGFKVRKGAEALEIDRPGKRVRFRAPDGTEDWLPYDKLMLATGASPIIPDLPGLDLAHIHTLHNIPDADAVRERLGGRQGGKAVVVGGGLIGVEMAEALAEVGYQVALIEMMPHILPMLDDDMAMLVEAHMRAKGVTLHLETRVEGFAGDGTVERVKTTGGELPADLAILAIGVRPNSGLARDAGLEVGPKGGIVVDDHMRTSDPDVYAAGDCVDAWHRVTGAPAFMPLGDTANKQGRVAAVNIAGGDDTFPGIVGTAICKVFDYACARTGITERAAREAGRDVVTARSPGPDKAHYYPGGKPIFMKVLVERGSRQVLGAQAVGPGACDRQINVVAMALQAGMTVDQLAQADLCYAPPYSQAIDNVITTANVARNTLDDALTYLAPSEVQAMRANGSAFTLLDVRTPREVEEVRIPGSLNIPLGQLRARVDEVPAGKPVVAFCKASLRGYEAALILRHAGRDDVSVLQGGLAMWPYEKEQ